MKSMKRSMMCILLVLLIMLACITGCSQNTNQSQQSDGETAINITDMAGREVKIPKTSNKVLSSTPIGTLFMYSLNPKKIAGLNWTPTESEKEYLDKDYLNLPMLSGWYADGKVGNVEEIVKANPDIILMNFEKKVNQAQLDQASAIQEKLNIPVVMFDSSIENMQNAYEFLGELVGEEKRAQELKKYITQLFDDVKTKAASIKEEDKVSVYYAEGPEGLLTDPSGSIHTRVIDLVGGINVAKVEVKQGMGRSQVSSEQLIKWNPDVIIACHDQGFAAENSTYASVIKDTRFSSIKAVKNNKIYEVPYKPFNFLDRPPSINRIIGVKWLGNLLYPDIYNYDIKKDTKEFYKLFYNIDLTENQIDDMYQYSK